MLQTHFGVNKKTTKGKTVFNLFHFQLYTYDKLSKLIKSVKIWNQSEWCWSDGFEDIPDCESVWEVDSASQRWKLVLGW